MLLNEKVMVKEIREEIKKLLQLNENTIYQNLWNTAKAVLRGGVHSYECQHLKIQRGLK
jgi:uncharacterized lipoprotein YddW (UPF0748 family)